MTKTLSQEHKLCDFLNHKTMGSREAVAHYSRVKGLKAAEQKAFEYVAQATQGQPILDLGMGGGRTIDALRKISHDYVGIDYAVEMVLSCREQYPDVDFRHADARDLSQFADSSFGLVVFSCEGISMVDHPGRLQVLSEIRRVLRPNGYFIFSTMNQNSPYMQRPFQFPEFNASSNPLRLAVRTSRFLADTLVRSRNRSKYKKQDIHTKEFSIINDEYHNYSTMIYYISLEQQKAQLAECGFDKAGITALDLAGEEIKDDTQDDTLTFVVQNTVLSSPPMTRKTSPIEALPANDPIDQRAVC